MLTQWGKSFDPANVLPEYPRPQMVRDSLLSLNGVWEYGITHDERPPVAYEGPIVVPFSPESPLSGVRRILQPHQTLWYRRTVRLPDSFSGGRVLLHFGAVDQEASVFWNGTRVKQHTGGYLPFTVDVTDVLREENELTVSVRDFSDTSYHSRGKQKLKRGGIWYTPQSGIWQTVWMERVPDTYIEKIRLTPHYDEAELELTVYAASDALCTAEAAGQTVAFPANRPVRIPVSPVHPWSPEDPYLYDLTVTMGEDRVKSYFAMRKFSVEKDGAGTPRMCLNGKPYFQTGVLDQGYWPDGLYTAPDDRALVADIEGMKALGFNVLRKHIKIEPLRFYYHCDRLGMLVWQDMVNGGDAYRRILITAPLFTGIHRRDGKRMYRRFARENPLGREEYRRETEETVELLYNCPCIAVWVPFNEGWGQFDAKDAVARIRKRDATRLIDHASGWHDQGAGDMASLHVYFMRYRFRPDARKRAVVVSEFGGYNLRVDGHCFNAAEFGYKRYESKEALSEAFERLYREEILPAKAKGLSAAIYTQLSDVEDELNGLYTYDRAVCKLDAARVRALNGALKDS